MNEELSSISRWICELKEGDLEAAQPLWERYFAKLVDVARRKLKGIPRGARDEEDVALSAFDSFCRAAKNGRFPKLHDRDELWRLLLAITVRKVIDQRRYEHRMGRDVKRTVGEGSDDSKWFSELLSSEPTPEFLATAAEQYQHLLNLLNDDLLQKVAVGKLEGYTNRELAERLDWSVSTIERCLRMIRKIWEQEVD